MPNMLTNGVDWLNAMRVSHMAEPVTLSSGRFTTSDISATFGRSIKQQVFDDNGSTVETLVTDITIAAADYVLNEEVTKPIAQHVITRADGRKYKPTPIVPGEPVWRWTTDIQPTTYRIHCIEVAN